MWTVQQFLLRGNLVKKKNLYQNLVLKYRNSYRSEKAFNCQFRIQDVTQNLKLSYLIHRNGIRYQVRKAGNTSSDTDTPDTLVLIGLINILHQLQQQSQNLTRLLACAATADTLPIGLETSEDKAKSSKYPNRVFQSVWQITRAQ